MGYGLCFFFFFSMFGEKGILGNAGSFLSRFTGVHLVYEAFLSLFRQEWCTFSFTLFA